MLKTLVFIMTAISTLFFSTASATEKTLHLNLCGDPDTLDPRISNNINACLVLNMLFQGLTEVGPNGKTDLILADSYTVSEDGKTYTFHLRKAKWSDGKDVTAEDFCYSWRSVLDPKTRAPCANLLYPIKNAERAARQEVSLDEVGVRAINPQTFEVELEKPVPFFLDLIAATVFFPVPKHQVENTPNWGSNHKLVVNGPFRPVEWNHFDRLVVEKNPSYWDASHVYLNRIELSMIANESTTLELFDQGRLDWLGGDYSPLPLDSLDTIKKKYELHRVPYGGTRYCPLNIHTFPFNNVNLRKAFSVAVNRQALIDHITLCPDEPATNMIVSVFRKNQQKQSLFPDGDAQLARKYLKKALEELKVEAKDLKITFKYENAEASHRLAQALQQQWQDVLGITVILEPGELKTFVNSLRKREFQMGLIYWMVHYNSPMDILDRYRSKDLLKNYPGWENKTYTDVLDAYFCEKDEEKQHHLLAKAEAIFIEEMPVIPLFHFSRPYVCQPKIKNMYINSIGDVYFTNVDFEEDNLLTDKK